MSPAKRPYADMTIEDEDLIRKAQQGDMLAFEQLVFRHDKKVLAIAARYVTSSDDAKDIYQEVFLKVYRGLKKFRFQSEFTTWLHRVAVNVCLTHRMRSRSQVAAHFQGEPGDDDQDPHGEPVDADDPPDHKAMQADLRRHVEKALDALSPKQRLVFTLRHYEGYKLREIAEMMDCMEGTVKRYLFAATRRMRDQLKDVL